MKNLVTFVIILLSTLSYSQTLLETVDLPTGTYWNSGYGMVYSNSKYWISSSSSSTGSGIIKAVDNTGSEVDQILINYPTMRASQGLAFDGTNFWYVERKTARCDLFKIAPDGTVLDSITTAQLFGASKYLGGAGWDGTGLWISVYFPNDEAALYKVDVNSKTVVDTIPVFGIQPTGITVKGDTLFYVMDGFDGDNENIYAVDLATKDTLFSFHVPEQPGTRQNPRGLAWDGTNFWLLAEPVGAGSGRQLFKYDLGGGGTPQIFVPVSEIYFPNTTAGNSTNYDLEIFNNGNAALTIDSAGLNINFFYYDPVSFPVDIGPGQSITITINFEPDDYNYYQGMLTIYNNDPVSPEVNVDLFGQGVLDGAVLALTDAHHDFGNIWVGEDAVTLWETEIINMGDQTLDISDMQFTLPEYYFDAPDIPFQILSTDTLTFTIFFYPTLEGNYIDTLKITSNDNTNPVSEVNVEGTGTFSEYNYGYIFWNYQVPLNPNTSSTEFRVEGLKPINDITGDGVDEVIIATDNYLLMCLNGAGGGTTFPVWTFNTYFNNSNAGSIGQSWEFGVQDAMQIADDLNGDGYNDVVIGTGGSNEHVYAIDGTNGEIIWEFGDDINYGLGDFEAIDVQRDFNGDDVNDVLAIADGNSDGTGYKKAFLFSGIDGEIIWQFPYPGPNPSFGKSIISVNDFTEDGLPDVVIAFGNNGSTNLKVMGLNGLNGQPVWDTEMVDNEPKELLELPLPGDSSDVIAAEYFGRIHRLNGSTGIEVWEYPLGGSAAVIQMALIEDQNGDLIPELLIASFAANGLNCLSGADGTLLWAHPMDFQYGVAVVPDIDFDGGEDVITGDQNGTFYCVSGKDGSLIFNNNFPGDRISSVNVMPSVDGNYSFELLAGSKEGKVVCFSGGVDTVSTGIVNEELIPDNFVLYQNYPNPFNPSTKIKFSIPSVETGHAPSVQLIVYDILGNEVTTLVNEEKPQGIYEVEFDASMYSSGVYFYQLRSGGFIDVKKMILLK
ncbi:MAG: choice-of-anchor D domain-containing protein [Ignavibacteria bacterium]|nr:MAG: choice-of-anchor D domain-containing protein [Ignavibacteria bacterium]